MRKSELEKLLAEQPKQGLTVRNGEPCFAIVFTPSDVADAADITEEEAAELIRNHAPEFVAGFLNNDWTTIIETVVQCIHENEEEKEK